MLKRTLLPVVTLALAGCATLPPDVPDEPLSVTVTFAEAGDLESMHALCYRFKYGKEAPQDFAKALVWCTRAATRGADSSQVLLAEMYRNGQGVETDDAKALRWYQAAAAQGHQHALLMLYFIYSEGRGVPADREKALTYLRRAADAQYPPAVQELAKQAAAH